MSEGYDIIQAPKNLTFENLPDQILINEPFTIDGIQYVLVKCNSRDLEVCKQEGDITTVPESISKFYSIKRL